MLVWGAFQLLYFFIFGGDCCSLIKIVFLVTGATDKAERLTRKKRALTSGIRFHLSMTKFVTGIPSFLFPAAFLFRSAGGVRETSERSVMIDKRDQTFITMAAGLGIFCV